MLVQPYDPLHGCRVKIHGHRGGRGRNHSNKEALHIEWRGQGIRLFKDFYLIHQSGQVFLLLVYRHYEHTGGQK